jgi:hypothetical protein
MTGRTKSFFQALISTFDHSSDLTWTTVDGSMTAAIFFVAEMAVTVRFSPLSSSCLVDYQIASKNTSAVSCVRSSLQIFNGILHSLRLFHRVHGPVVYRFASDDEDLANLWEAYRECPLPMAYEIPESFRAQ